MIVPKTVARLAPIVAVGAVLTGGVWVAQKPAAAAAAAPKRIVWVDAKASKVWHVGSAVAFLNKYTGAKLKRGNCHKGAECIVIREKWNMDPRVAGMTYVNGGTTTTIHLNGTKRRMSWGQRRNTLIHELGHARGIYTHDHTCVSVMYESTNCNHGTGRVAPLRFTRAEKKILHNH
jgi:hypothetical protein